LELNQRGYGTDPALGLDLVYNPSGAFLPPDQAALEIKSPPFLLLPPLPPLPSLMLHLLFGVTGTKLTYWCSLGRYKQELDDQFGIVFNSLFTFTNMPIKRFADFLYRRGELNEYMTLLVRNFNRSTVKGLMCSNTVSVNWDGALHLSHHHILVCYRRMPLHTPLTSLHALGALFDCDFNQQVAR
jgi:hypothetical protein